MNRFSGLDGFWKVALLVTGGEDGRVDVSMYMYIVITFGYVISK